jgi:hypothetical protein
MTGEEQQMQKWKLLQASNLPQQIRGPHRREPGLITRKRQRRRGRRQTPPVNKNEIKIRHTDFEHTHITLNSFK